MAAYVFLAMNHRKLTADPDAYAHLVLSVARGDTPKSAVAELLRADSMRGAVE